MLNTIGSWQLTSSHSACNVFLLKQASLYELFQFVGSHYVVAIIVSVNSGAKPNSEVKNNSFK